MTEKYNFPQASSIRAEAATPHSLVQITGDDIVLEKHPAPMWRAVSAAGRSNGALRSC